MLKPMKFHKYESPLRTVIILAEGHPDRVVLRLFFTDLGFDADTPLFSRWMDSTLEQIQGGDLPVVMRDAETGREAPLGGAWAVMG